MTTPDELDQIVASAVADMAIFDTLSPSIRNLLANYPHDWEISTIPISNLRDGPQRLRKALDRQIKLMESSDG